MPQETIKGRIVAMLATDAFEQAGLTDTRKLPMQAWRLMFFALVGRLP